MIFHENIVKKFVMVNLSLKYNLFYYLECSKPSVTAGIKIKSEKDSYNHGEKIEFECLTSDGYTTEGDDSSTCDDGSFAITFKCNASTKFYLLLFCITILTNYWL